MFSNRMQLYLKEQLCPSIIENILQGDKRRSYKIIYLQIVSNFTLSKGI